MSASCLGFYLLDFFCLILEIDSFPASGLYHYSALKYPLNVAPMAACGDRKERACARLHTCMFLVFTVVGGGETHWIQNVALSGQCVGFRALVQE